MELHETGRNAWLRLEADGVTVNYKRDGVCEASHTFDTTGKARGFFGYMANIISLGRYCEEQRIEIVERGVYE